jgi:putative ABC transport system permease protein
VRTMFDLERAIEEWAKSLRKKPALQDGDLVELESYLRDQIEALIGRGLGEEEAFRRAEEKFARAEELDGDYHRARAGTGGGYPALLWNFIRVAQRRIRKQMGIAFIKVVGLAVGLACVVLFFMTWSYERSFDSRIGNVGRIFRVDEKAPDGTGAAMKGIYSRFSDLVGGSVPEIEETARIAEVGIALLRHGGKSLQQQFNFKYADSALFRLMSLPFVRGDARTALDDPDSVVLSESTARKLFGRDDPLGKTLQIVFFQFDGPSRTLDFTIRGLLKDQPSASSYRFEALLPFQLKNRLDSGTLRDWAFTENRAITFIRARNGIATGDLENKIKTLALSSAVPSKSEPADRIKNMVLTPLAGLHLADVELGRYLNLLAAISLVVLLLAGINFVNLSTAEASVRTKEVGLRKIVGAGRGHLAVQFLIESVFLALLALGLALLLVEAARPFFQTAVGREIAVAELWGAGFIAGLLAIATATGLLAGAYPAFYLSGLRPFQLLAMSRTPSWEFWPSGRWSSTGR